MSFIRTTIAVIVAIILFIALISTFGALLNVIYLEGCEATETGTVSAIEWRHNKLFNFDYTYVTFISFSGDEYRLKLLDHVELDFGATYTIVYKYVSPLGHHVCMYGEVVSITPVNVTKTWAWYPP